MGPEPKEPAPARASADPLRELDDPLRELDDPLRELADPLRELADPLRELADPLRELDDPLRELDDPLRELDDPLRELAGRRVVVLGACGFIGSRVVLRAAQLGARVLAVVHGEPVLAHERLAPVPANVSETGGDLCGDPDRLQELLDGADIVCNLAGRSGQVSSLAESVANLEVNVHGTLALLSAMQQVAPRARVIFASSRLVYGRATRTPVTVGSPTVPTSFYGIHKLAAESYHRLFHEHHGLATTVLRITNPYGPRRPGATARYGIVNWFCEIGLAGQPLPIFGRGEQLRDYCYVDDVVEAVLLSALHPAAIGATYNVGGGFGVPFVEMARQVSAAVGAVARPPELRFQDWPPNAALVETGDFVADVAPIGAALGWQPRTSMAAGLAATIARYQEHAERESRRPAPTEGGAP